jgi:2-iminobutanoate/2-iminopropanoate deaminase
VKPEFLSPNTVGPPTDPFSHVVRVDRTLYLAGQISLDEENRLVGIGDPGAQAEQCWTNIEAVLRFAGSSLENVVKMTIFLKDIRDASAETAVRKRLFAGRPLPACTQVQVANLGFPELLMEIDVIAVVGDD